MVVEQNTLLIRLQYDVIHKMLHTRTGPTRRALRRIGACVRRGNDVDKIFRECNSEK